MSEYNIALFSALALTLLVQLLYKRTTAWWCWQHEADVVLGLVYSHVKGAPPFPEAPFGLRNSSSITVGLGLVMVRVDWFGRVPKKWDHDEPPHDTDQDLAKPHQAEPGNEP